MGSIPVRSTKNGRVIKYVGCFLCLFVAEIEPRFDRLRGGRAPFVVQYFVFPTFPPLSGEFTRQEYQKRSSNKIRRLFFYYKCKIFGNVTIKDEKNMASTINLRIIPKFDKNKPAYYPCFVTYLSCVLSKVMI